ncbi:uncharacterized protein EDB93DRAFT_1257031 [Suillus bovinus]|uniref:uncharacterized protein n=1 Tax=Suillus bovinus TaxID=48563 RepID=UPI001B871247|nr:uncharacterized protein EDB93DRAFT_1257031 [Suillus bovinus]KAG2127467.1 hypothetical protein EDB93DRAFT_1257031 [Suillus bovinus]
MARTKQTSRRRPQHLGKVLQPHFQPHFQPVRAQHRAMVAAKPGAESGAKPGAESGAESGAKSGAESGAKSGAESGAKSGARHVAISRALPQPIRAFRIPVSKAELPMAQWDARAPHRIHYGVPELINYGARDSSQLACLRVPAVKDGKLIGYVPLPSRYLSSWLYLCYCVEHWLAIWKCWDGESKKKQRKTKKTNIKIQRKRTDLINTSRKNAGARFLQAMVARRMVLEECIANGVNDDRIESLDEFLIRNYRDWLFLEFDELPDDAHKYLEADPLYARNKKLFETGWDVKEDNISLSISQAGDAWMLGGLDLTEMFKKEMNLALKELTKGGEMVDITHDQNAELPDKWHESHEPPIRFMSERKEEFIRNGFTLDEPLVFLYYCLQDDEEIERESFLREIMDMLPNDETRQQWSLRVDKLFDGEMKWDDFSNLVGDELDLELAQRVNSMGPESDNPFLKMDARIAVRAYLRNLQNNPNNAADIFRKSISRFSDPDAKDSKLWGWVMKKVKANTVITTLQSAHSHRLKWLNSRKGKRSVTLPNATGKTNHVQQHSSASVSDTRPTPPADVMSSDMNVDQAEETSRGHSFDTENNIVLDRGQHSGVQSQGDPLTTSTTPPNHTPDAMVEYQDDSPSTPAQEDDQLTGDDDIAPESLFSLVAMQQAINAFSCDGISFNELRNILLTDTPLIHVNTIHEALQTLSPERADKKTLQTLLKTLLGEEALAKGAVDRASMN